MSHGDFYFTINATFYHFTDTWGEQALIEYWHEMGREYLAPLAQRFVQGGLTEIGRYWEDYFAHEPGAQVVVSLPQPDRVLLEVQVCPAIRWLSESEHAKTHPPAHPMYCQHCLHVNQAMLERTDFEFQLEGGGGSCRQWFIQRD